MMKKPLLFISFLFNLFFAQAQSYSYVNTLEESAWQLVPALNGNYYSVAWEPNCPNDFIVIRYFNKMGDVVHTFKSPPYIGSISSISAVTNTLNHIVLYLRGSDINHLLYEFDEDGSLIWNNNIQFTNPIIKYTKLVLSPTGYYLLGNTYSTIWTDSAQAIITKLNNTGKHQWTKNYRINNDSPASTHFNDMLYDNNTLLCVGRYYNTDEVIGHAPFRPTFTKLDTSGNVLESYYYMVDSLSFPLSGFDEYEFMQVDKTPAGHFYLVGNNFGNEHALFKMNSSFNLEWINEKLSGKSTAMCAGYDEDVFISPEGEFRNFVLQFNSAGQVIGNHVTRNPSSGANFSSDHLTHLIRHDCGFLFSNSGNVIAHANASMTNCLDSSITGFGNYYPVTHFFRGSAPLASGNLTSFNEYLTTLVYSPYTSTATNHCSAAINCTGLNGLHEMDETEIVVYPNPSSGMVNIDCSSGDAITNVQLLDLNGKILIQSALSGLKTFQLNISSIQSGIYLLQFSNGKNSFIRKLEILN